MERVSFISFLCCSGRERVIINAFLRIISDQIIEDMEGGKFDVVGTRASAESATDRQFLQSLKKNTTSVAV